MYFWAKPSFKEKTPTNQIGDTLELGNKNWNKVFRKSERLLLPMWHPQWSILRYMYVMRILKYIYSDIFSNIQFNSIYSKC